MKKILNILFMLFLLLILFGCTQKIGQAKSVNMGATRTMPTIARSMHATTSLPESVEFGSPSDILEIDEYLGDVRPVFSKSNFDALKSTTIENMRKTKKINQYLKFPTDSGKVIFDQDERDIVGHFLYFADGEKLFEYELEFEKGFISNVESGLLRDLVFCKEDFTILGEEFDVGRAIYKGTLSITLRNKQKNKLITFEDEDPTPGSTDGKVFVDGNLIEDAMVNIEYQVRKTYDRRYPLQIILTKITYTLYSDAILGDVYVAPGHGVRGQLSEPEGMLTEKWDIIYEGLMDTGVNYIRYDAIGNSEYDLEFTNQEGIFYDHPLLSNRDTGFGLVYGDRNDDLWFTECMYSNRDIAYNIGNGDYFILSTCMANPYNSNTPNIANNNCYTHVLRFSNIDTINKIITFEDLGTGIRDINYNTNNTGYLVAGGVTYIIKKDPITNNLAIDLNGDGMIASELNNKGYGKVLIGQTGDGLINLGWQACFDTNNSIVNRTWPITEPTTPHAVGGKTNHASINIITLQKEFDEANNGEDEILNTDIIQRANNKIGTDTGVTARQGIFQGLFQLQNNRNIWQGLSKYGIFTEWYNPENFTDQAEDLTFEYPLSQRGAHVFVEFKT